MGDNWISVKERLPENDTWVLVYITYNKLKYIEIGEFNFGFLLPQLDENKFKVLAWQPYTEESMEILRGLKNKDAIFIG